MPKTVILSAARTPIGKLGGGLSSLDATELGGTAIKAALERADVAPEQVQHVVMGQVIQAGQGQIPSRQAQIKAGIPKEVSSETINKVCASGIRAAGHARRGDPRRRPRGRRRRRAWSRCRTRPYLLKEARFGFRMGDAKAIDAMINDGLTNPFSGKHMAQEASEVAAELELTRPDMDRWALRSHELAIKATDEGRLPEEIVPVTVKGKKGDTVVEIDEAPRRDTSLETLAKLPPIFIKDGSHTAGNSPGRQRRRRRAGAGQRRVGQAQRQDACWRRSSPRPQVADDFAYLARTPAKAAEKALEKAGLNAEDIDLWEINEAFASVTLNSIRMLGIDEDKVNVNGGAVALGHPIGASGARILGALVLRAAPPRRRPRLRRDLLGRRPGRRGDRGGERRLSSAAPTRVAAAFFDLDRTLMEGSSAFQFGRAAYRAGLMSRRQLAR